MADNPIYDDKNVVLYDDLGNKVNVTLIDGVYRLATETVITGGAFSIQPFTPKVVFDSTGIALTTAWTELINETGIAGKFDFLACSTGTSNYKIRFTVDSVVVFEIAMSDLNAIGLTNAVNINIWAETALKNFRYRPLNSVDFTDNMKFEAAMTTGTGTLYYLATYRLRA
jgi:hypothetical protein